MPSNPICRLLEVVVGPVVVAADAEDAVVEVLEVELPQPASSSTQTTVAIR
jgi:hypothetical protein